ncbi:DNA-directed RNA polymerase III subunit RPC7 [Poecile atricapillus]|uniref:DNA-directed RNA polymerase III subunit RPC7 n=1 Tax=Poecile atricapillus TaxID=48891 RepID=UPI0027390C58|nr:DNA-directed RNA polymerase III subunit RPC7 [Poecile atricapillus]
MDTRQYLRLEKTPKSDETKEGKKNRCKTEKAKSSGPKSNLDVIKKMEELEKKDEEEEKSEDEKDKTKDKEGEDNEEAEEEYDEQEHEEMEMPLVLSVMAI